MRIVYWLRGLGPGGKDVVPMYDCGKCDNPLEGKVGYDRKCRPVFLGDGEYTATYGGGDIFLDPECEKPV